MTADLRYPVGKFAAPAEFTAATRAAAIADIAALPDTLRAAVTGLSDAQLDTPYRPGGWTVRQLVHHVADSHVNAYTRIRLALTEENPTIKPYDENKWADLPDAKSLPVEVSLGIVHGIHHRWVALLKTLTPADYARTVVHPEHGRQMSIDFLTAMYAWHSRHHVAHVTELRRREGW
jgi:hypothetical protein